MSQHGTPIGSSWKAKERFGVATTGVGGHGPGDTDQRSAQKARAATVFGSAVPLGVLLPAFEDVALDMGKSPADYFRFAGLCLFIGSVIAVLVSTQIAPKRAGGSFAAISAMISAAAFLLLFNTGDTEPVKLLVGVGLIGLVTPIAVAAAEARLQDSNTPWFVHSASTLAAGSLGTATGALVTFLDPEWPWATVCAAGAVVALVGALWRWSLPDRLFGPKLRSTDRAARNDGLGLAWGVLGGAVLGSIGRLPGALDDRFAATQRYHVLTIGLGALLAALVANLSNGTESANGRPVDRGVFDVPPGYIALLCGGSAMFGAASETLPGMVIAFAIAFASAASLVAVASTSSAVPAAAAFATAAATVAYWSSVVDAMDSEFYALAAVALPCAVFGLSTALGALKRPTTAAATEPVPGAEVKLLEVADLNFAYGDVDVLFGVNLDVSRGEIVAVVGANGAGKTTLLRAIAGFGQPKSGSVTFGGTDVSGFTADERVAMGLNQIAGGAAVAPDLTVAENLDMYAITLDRDQRAAAIGRAYEQFPRLEERKNQQASLLSGGERQMLALSKALILRPQLLVIDELSLGLAPIVIRDLERAVRALHASGTSVLLVEQSVHVALDLASRAYCMEKGEIVLERPAEELLSDPKLLETVYLEGVSAALGVDG